MTSRWIAPALALALAWAAPAAAQTADDSATTLPEQTPAEALAEYQSAAGTCADFPQGELSDEQLRQLVPDQSPGKVFIRWRTETQEDNYGFNIYRAKSADGPYEKVNESIIPGEGSTNIPTDYCYVDLPLPRGEVVYYYIESVSNSGVAETIGETKGTKVKVKTVAEEREWLRKKAAGVDTRAAATTASQSAASDPATTAPAAP